MRIDFTKRKRDDKPTTPKPPQPEHPRADEMVADFNGGMPKNDICRKFHTSNWKLDEILARRGITRRQRIAPKRINPLGEKLPLPEALVEALPHVRALPRMGQWRIFGAWEAGENIKTIRALFLRLMGPTKEVDL